MKRLTAQQALFISALLFLVSLAMSCHKADSRDNDRPNPSEARAAHAGPEQLQRITLRITGMS